MLEAHEVRFLSSSSSPATIMAAVVITAPKTMAANAMHAMVNGVPLT